jgi:prevent-host-death family protein
MVMKSVKIAELKAKLSQHLREVRRGHSVIVLDRDTPIARLVPYSPDAEGLIIRKPLRRRRSLRSVPLPKPLKLDFDIVELLLEERQGER